VGGFEGAAYLTERFDVSISSSVASLLQIEREWKALQSKRRRERKMRVQVRRGTSNSGR
jgi:CelD/BcsL family acetyltransferase involved in cellulose biosynthesis